MLNYTRHRGKIVNLFLFYLKGAKMTTSAMLMQEIETLPEEAATEVLNCKPQ